MSSNGTQSKKRPKTTLYNKVIKRLLDAVCSFFAIVFLLPLLFVLALVVAVKLGRPVIFKQKRPGLNERVFTLYKFRTMTEDKDEKGNFLPDKDRLTKFGRLLRATSLDELPELFNILVGDMSFIGPRPLLVRYLTLYNDHQKRRHEVRPGLSGLAQVSGRNTLNWIDKFNFDVEYVDNVSLMLDIKILLATFKKVFSKDGIEFAPGMSIAESLTETIYENSEHNGEET